MIALVSFPVVLSCLLIAAHFYRSGSLALTVVCLFVPFLLISSKRWIPKVVTLFLLLAAGEWIRTMLLFIEQYEAAGVSWKRLAVILSAVAICTALSSLVFRTSVLKRKYL